VLLLATGQIASGQPPKSKSDAADELFNRRMGTFLGKYCVECHSGPAPDGKLDLTEFRPGIAVQTLVQTDAKTRKHVVQSWKTISGKLHSGEMPPPDAPQPPQSEREFLAQWIDTQLAKVFTSGPRDPGRVTIRRLNRAEYNNTIRDLVGVDFQPADDFPADDVGYGFDNIGDVLSMPPLLLEKYLAAAEKIARQAIEAESPPEPKTYTFDALQLSGGNILGREHPTRILVENGDVFVQAQVPQDGDYTFNVTSCATQAGKEPARMTVYAGTESIKTIDVTAKRAAPQTDMMQVHLKKGQTKLAVEFINDFYDPDNPDPKQRDRNLIVVSLQLRGPLKADLPNLSDSRSRLITAWPSSNKSARGKSSTDCAREILDRFASRAYRRPARPEEVDRLLKLCEVAEQEGDFFPKSLQLAMQAVLVSPHFLFRRELDSQPNNPSAVHALDDFELASRLSYFLWSSMPDDELFALARQNALRTRGNLESQVRRMLKDPKSRALVDNFAEQWLQIRNLKNVTPDPERFPQFNDALRADMQTETEVYFAHVLHEDRSVLEFLDADYTFVNERLARHYGISGVLGNHFRQVHLDDKRRGGVLTQGSVLTVTSNPTRTSPVKRGKWILEQILGAPPPAPPPGAGELRDDKEVVLQGTLRQRMEQHRANPNCASCHSRMDPLGFALENYDAIGAWRDKDSKFPVDASGSLPNGQSFQGAAGLKDLLKTRQEAFVRCLAEKMLTYALGRGVEPYDQPVLDQIYRSTSRNDYRFSTIILEVVKSEPFQKRRGDGGTP
jgi:hypothetical protein